MAAPAAAQHQVATIRSRPMAARPTLVATPALRYYRTLLAVPQTELAELAHCSLSTVQRLERGGSARLSTVRRLAVALEVSPAQLMAQLPEN